MPTIDLSQTVFDKLKELAEPLVDNPDTVVQRLLDAYHANGRSAASTSATLKPARAVVPKIIGRDRRRARKGEKTTIEEFYAPILRVLKEAGGKLPVNEAIEGVGKLMADRLNEVDHARLPSGEIRWRN